MDLLPFPFCKQKMLCLLHLLRVNLRFYFFYVIAARGQRKVPAAGAGG